MSNLWVVFDNDKYHLIESNVEPTKYSERYPAPEGALLGQDVTVVDGVATVDSISQSIKEATRHQVELDMSQVQIEKTNRRSRLKTACDNISKMSDDEIKNALKDLISEVLNA